MGWSMRNPGSPGQRPSWRQYQAMLQKRRPAWRSGYWKIAALVIAAAVCLLYVVTATHRAPSVAATDASPRPTDASSRPADASPRPELESPQPADESPPRRAESPPPMVESPRPVVSSRDILNRDEIRLLIDSVEPSSITAGQFSIPIEKNRLVVETTLDDQLQSRLTEALDRKNSRYVGILVMEADNGRVLAMVGFDKSGTNGNPCLSSIFPAASIFKIVSAAAAVDHCGFNPDTRLYFNGYKHTLYKRQLVEKKDRWTTEIDFKESFADSVNPIFGKIGAHRLGKPVLEQYARAFGFNRPIPFEMAVQASRIAIDDEPYHLAEVASGFNNDTTISPLHGALIASAVLNGGRMIAPTIVDSVLGQNEHVLYRSRTEWQGRAMSPQAAATLARLMRATIDSGTARRVFRGIKRVRGMDRIEIGGKTGSISTPQNDTRFDWFVGFAQDPERTERLAVSVVVGHEEYIGTRAAQYARMAITHVFGQNSAAQVKPAPRAGG